MTRKEKIIAGILIGAAAGVAGALFFDTENGKKVLADIKKIAAETIDDAIARFASIEEKYKEKLAETDAEDTLPPQI